jgi:hypothetical protein
MKKFIWFIFLACAVVFAWGFLKQQLLVRKIECFTQYGYCPDIYLAKLNAFKSISLVGGLPKKQIAMELNQFSEIKKFNVYRRLPETLVVSVILRKPLSGISDSVLGWKTGIDSEGQVFSIDPSPSLPLIITDKVYQPGEKVNGTLLTAGRFLSDAADLAPSRLIGRVNGNRLDFAIGAAQVVVDLDKSPSNWPSSLQSILNRSKMGLKFPKVIDLRFSQPVLTY